MIGGRWLVVALVLVGACAGSTPKPAAPPPPAAKASAINLSLRVQATTGQRSRAVAAGDTLHSGDRLEMVVQVDQPAYVYVVQFFADGSSAVLFPAQGDMRVQPGGPTRIPDQGQSFQLDDAVGEENIYVVASARPLAEADQAASQVVEQIRVSSAGAMLPTPVPSPTPSAAPAETGGTAKDAAPAGKAGGSAGAAGRPTGAQSAAGRTTRPRKPRPGPGALTMRTRGLVVVNDDETHAVHARTDSEGVAVFRFWFQHVP